MLAQAAGWWNRLLGGTLPTWAPNQMAVAEDERRVWIRFPANLETHLVEPNQPNSQAFAARICDISRGGSKFVTDRPLHIGSLLTFVLPAASGTASISVLACVVHSRPAGEGEWHIGCSFSAELDDDDLRAFGAIKARPKGPDSRSRKRFPCDGKATYQRLSEGDLTHYPAQVENISANGVALLVADEIPTGMLLNAELASARGHTFSILACVVHVTSAPHGGFLAGCNFIRELNDADLESLRADGCPA